MSKLKFEWIIIIEVMHNIHSGLKICRDHFVNAPRQWEFMLQCNIVSHLWGEYTKWSLNMEWIIWHDQILSMTL